MNMTLAGRKKARYLIVVDEEDEDDASPNPSPLVSFPAFALAFAPALTLRPPTTLLHPPSTLRSTPRQSAAAMGRRSVYDSQTSLKRTTMPSNHVLSQ